MLTPLRGTVEGESLSAEWAELDLAEAQISRFAPRTPRTASQGG